jgi:hypothetical protein
MYIDPIDSCHMRLMVLSRRSQGYGKLFADAACAKK